MKGKFLIMSILAALLVGSNAMASIARVSVFGTQPVFTAQASGMSVVSANGSLWYDDDYNVFYNPAYINDTKNRISVEKGVEGGFFKGEFENFAYGVYFNRGGNGTTGIGTSSNAQSVYGGSLVAPGFNPSAWIGTAENLPTQRPIDLFVGGDTGLKWGLHLAWAYDRDQTVAVGPSFSGGEVTNRYWHLDGGVQVMGLEPYAGITAFSKYQNNGPNPATASIDEVNVGARYKYEGWCPYVSFEKTRVDGSPAQNNGVQNQTRVSDFGFGLSHDTKVADGVHIYKNVGLWWAWYQDDLGTGQTQSIAGIGAAASSAATAATNLTGDDNNQYTDIVLPVNIAIEADAASWLTLRAGASYDFINDRNYASNNNQASAVAQVSNRHTSGLGNTKFRIGSTLKFGKLHVDSAFGNGSANQNLTGASSRSSLDNNALGFDSQTFALVSVGYHW